MASTSETGHAKNVANFEVLISSCTGYGTPYNPSNTNLKVPQLQTLLTNSKSALLTVKTTGTTFENARNAREIVLAPAPIKKFCTRILNALEATNASALTVDDAKAINRKIQGKRAGDKLPPPVTPPVGGTTPTPPEVIQISVSQQSYDSLIDNFNKFVVCLAAEPSYVPNENDLKVTALNTTLTNYRTLNTAVINAAIPFKNAMIARNTVLYQAVIGLVDTALEVKKYVKSVFGATSPQYKQISKLEFKRITK
ncbi:MAG: hypothetical protein ABR968_13015 [Bacteroidales bacterium]|jgi:hypothetical protein